MKDPAFLFYPSDFFLGVSTMAFEDRGKYITILCVMHQQGRLKEESIRLLVGSVSDMLRLKFDVDKNGYWFNERLEIEMEKRKKFTESRKINGSKGGRPKITKPLGLASANLVKDVNKDINKGKNINKDISMTEDMFELFWLKYPKKQDKKKAKEKFLRLNSELFETIMYALDYQTQSKSWKEGYIPYPTTWLNGERWDDEVEQSLELKTYKELCDLNTKDRTIFAQYEQVEKGNPKSMWRLK